MRRITVLITVLVLCMAAYISPAVAQTEQEKFTLGGFMAVDCLAFDFDEDHSILGIKDLTPYQPFFSQTNLNLYFMYNSQKNWIAFSEIKFTYLLSDPKPNTDNIASGYISSEPQSYTYTDEMLRTYDLGGIFIERAYIEYNQFQFAKVRFGRFLTPFGIFSQDHGAPAVISVRPPNLVLPASNGIVTSNGMPLNQTGGELLGNIYLGDFGIEYAAYMSNGPSEDPNANGDNVMCNGGFLNLIMPEIAETLNIEFGGSVYQGKRTYTKANFIDTTTFTADESKDIYALRQRDFITAGHLKTAVSGLPLDGIFLLQAEYLHQQITDKEEIPLTGGNPLPVEDYNYDVYYIQLEYQMFGMLTPYCRYEEEGVSNKKAAYSMFFTGSTQYLFGLNIKPIPNVSLKLEYLDAKLHETDYAKDVLKHNNNFRMYGFQITMAFL